MKYVVTESGGRLLQGSTTFGQFRVEWDKDNHVVMMEHALIAPVQSPPEPGCSACGDGLKQKASKP